MSREEFIEILDEIDGAFNQFTLSDNLVKTWYKYLGSFSKDILSNVVSDYIRENSKAPSIADLYPRCTKLSKLYGTGDD